MLRPRDTDALRAELRQVAAEGGVPVLFGGEVHDDALLLTEFVGTRTSGLRGLTVRSNSGLGGASMVAGRPMSVADYRNAMSITHDYDTPVLTEGLCSVLAVPVVIGGTARAVLYGAYRSGAPFGGRAADLMVGSARRLAQEMRVRDEVDRRLRLREAQLTAAVNPETIREVYAGLRILASRANADTGAELHRLADLLSAPAEDVQLTPREIDVLAQIALGCTNAEAAERLSLKTETVKSYLRSAAAKLGTHTRHETVSRARRSRLLP